MMPAPSSDWIGRSLLGYDLVTPQPLERLAALLDYAEPPWPPGEVPPLAHWLYFQPQARQSALGRDGHPANDPLVPPHDLPRRMWAGGRLRFLRPFPIGVEAARRSTIQAVDRKQGASGRLLFVTLRHDVLVGDDTVLSEEQNLVYREDPAGAPASAPPAAAPAPAPADAARALTLDAVQLFRFSALTFNSHRIHYDRPYAVETEGYRGLVAHGPLLATLLMRHYLDRRGGGVADFAFRARRPVFAGEPMVLNLADTETGAALWVADGAGATCMSAEVSRA